MKINEEYIQYLWKHQIFPRENLLTSEGEQVEVLHPGLQNKDAGPDFFNAKIKINQTIWAGNVEIHLRSSDWYRHSHATDKAYDNVVLQVVLEDDKDVFRTKGEKIPTMEMTIDLNMFERYTLLMENEKWVSCQDKLDKVDDLIIAIWLEKLSVERLGDKTSRIQLVLKKNKNDWEATFFFFLAINFGFKINAEAFEMLARSLPYKCLNKHKNNLFQLEALLFGQAGMLMEDKPGDEYYEKLKKEYLFFAKKYHLQTMESHLWKFMRLRPNNFPTVRIAQLAALINNSSGFFSSLLEAKEIEDFRNLFRIETSEYWHTHYNFGKKSAKKKKVIGKDAFFVIMINTVVPLLFVYGKSKGEERICEHTLELMEAIPSEKNSIIIKWNEIGIQSVNARNSQALIQLKQNYCNNKNCLNCQMGNELIRKEELL